MILSGWRRIIVHYGIISAYYTEWLVLIHTSLPLLFYEDWRADQWHSWCWTIVWIVQRFQSSVIIHPLKIICYNSSARCEEIQTSSYLACILRHETQEIVFEGWDSRFYQDSTWTIYNQYIDHIYSFTCQHDCPQDRILSVKHIRGIPQKVWEPSIHIAMLFW